MKKRRTFLCALRVSALELIKIMFPAILFQNQFIDVVAIIVIRRSNDMLAGLQAGKDFEGPRVLASEVDFFLYGKFPGIVYYIDPTAPALMISLFLNICSVWYFRFDSLIR